MLAVLCHPFSVSAKCMLQVRVVFSLTDDTLDVQISVNTHRERRCRGTSAVVGLFITNGVAYRLNRTRKETVSGCKIVTGLFSTMAK
jgi:hypothetical protein